MDAVPELRSKRLILRDENSGSCDEAVVLRCPRWSFMGRGGTPRPSFACPLPGRVRRQAAKINLVRLADMILAAKFGDTQTGRRNFYSKRTVAFGSYWPRPRPVLVVLMLCPNKPDARAFSTAASPMSCSSKRQRRQLRNASGWVSPIQAEVLGRIAMVLEQVRIYRPAARSRRIQTPGSF